MRKLAFICICYWVCTFNYAFAQVTDTLKKAAALEAVVGKDAVYVIDGKISDKKLDGLDPNAILSVDILKKDTTSAFKEIVRNNTVIITTKGFASIQYQKKLSVFSKKYKNYLELNKGDDSKLSYVLNGKLFDESDKRIKSLYDISPGKIKEVIFIEKFYKNTLNNIKEIVIITTK
ncbi:hypothetical protein G7092_12820 [Mucilaginibacter sp. HC2]|uniref:hypothetical protein n=1 Tax=Mucilaginibacter inviolabilis TaxID=2714892 RepID=UPI001409B9BC|nr:hypothetical protein [Mucilaginibacter inviolabilis]NHA04689.1 hypothetical protein [Mucilaginibacter inviolabilis]